MERESTSGGRQESKGSGGRVRLVRDELCKFVVFSYLSAAWLADSTDDCLAVLKAVTMVDLSAVALAGVWAVWMAVVFQKGRGGV
jgi:hypothetical protein